MRLNMTSGVFSRKYTGPISVHLLTKITFIVIKSALPLHRSKKTDLKFGVTCNYPINNNFPRCGIKFQTYAFTQPYFPPGIKGSYHQ